MVIVTCWQVISDNTGRPPGRFYSRNEMRCTLNNAFKMENLLFTPLFRHFYKPRNAKLTYVDYEPSQMNGYLEQSHKFVLFDRYYGIKSNNKACFNNN